MSKPRYLLEVLNYELPVTTLNSLTSADCTADGFDPEDICRDFYLWRSNTISQIDIYFEISESDAFDCFAILRSNLSIKAQVYLSGSNVGGIGGFSAPLFTRSLTRKNDNWLFYSGEILPACQYYKLTIVEDETSENEYVEISRIICGKSAEFPFEVLDGYTNSKESYQKRETQAGQWRPGSENSMLNTLDVAFRPANGTRFIKTNEYEKIFEMESFINQVKTSRPFLLILNPNSPLDFFDYVTVDGDEIEISYSEADSVNYSLTFKELK